MLINIFIPAMGFIVLNSCRTAEISSFNVNMFSLETRSTIVHHSYTNLWKYTATLTAGYLGHENIDYKTQDILTLKPNPTSQNIWGNCKIYFDRLSSLICIAQVCRVWCQKILGEVKKNQYPHTQPAQNLIAIVLESWALEEQFPGLKS